ncbi:Maf family protein [Risungbinella massiliensis]|uniref:Maf family protein n=1 Tax=Risungbinella massiliensis TaxID=1329796 RepID=UPI0005CBDE5D|nr:Maf family protein [Risungbinella massiliensis]
MKSWKLILASGSPRRRELLHQLELEFQVITSDVEEHVDPTLTPDQVVQALALQKAEAVSFEQEVGTVTVGADTVVVLDGEILGKPKDKAEAHEMLARLSGRSHEVYTGIAVVVKGSDETKSWTRARRTEVWMRDLDDEKREWYVETGEPMDKAGSYGIQGYGATLVDRIEGCYFNVVGFPLALFDELLEEIGLPVIKTFGKK